MGKKHKDNKKCTKKNSVQKEHVNKCQELLFDETGNLIVSQSEIETNENDKDQRRDARLGAIVAIVAVIGTLCVFLFRMTLNALNIWSEQGVIYWYLQALFSLALSTVVIIILDIVWYLICDLRRYNVIDPNYKQYDEASDNKYKYLISDFKIYIISLIVVFYLFLPLSVFYSEESEKYTSIVAALLCGLSGCIYIFTWIKRRKEEIKKEFWDIVGKIGIWLIGGFACFAIGIIFVDNSEAFLTVEYNANGVIEIENSSTDNYDKLEIMIYNMSDEIIYAKSIEKVDLLFAREAKYISNKIDGKIEEALLLNSEWLHWKYLFDLKQVEEITEGRYIAVLVHQEGKQALLINSFLIEDEEFNFAKHNMNKEY